MGNVKSSNNMSYIIFIDDKKEMENISDDIIVETLDELINAIIMENTEYRCIVEHKDCQIHISGVHKNNSVIYQSLLHVIRLE